MNIWAGAGDIVVYSKPSNGTDFDQDRASRHLIPGLEYVVHEVEVGSCRSIVTLYLGNNRVERFNAALFEDVNIDEEAAERRAENWYANCRVEQPRV